MYRDQLNDIKIFHDKQKLIGSSFDDRDVIAIAKSEKIGVAVILRIRSGRIISREKLSMTNLDNSDKNNMYSVITRFYLNSDLIPQEISLHTKPSNDKEIILWLSKKQRETSVLFTPKKEISPKN